MSELTFLKNLKDSLKHRNLQSDLEDDCALLQLPSLAQVVTTDMIVEGVHFDLRTMTPYQIGRKALAVNLSDLASKGATPRYFFLSLSFNKRRDDGFESALLDGVLDLAQEFEVQLRGGDTNYWDSPLAINIALLGTPHPKSHPLRSGAKPGDLIIVTGELGDTIDRHHYSFEPRVDEAIALLDRVKIHAMADISDGLATDLNHILLASKVGARVSTKKIPIKKSLLQSCPFDQALKHAMTDGEDFELVFCISPEEWRKLQSLKIPELAHMQLTCIGEVQEHQGFWLSESGKDYVMPWKGYEHGSV